MLWKWSYVATLRSFASSSSSSLSPQCRRSVSQGQGSFQSPGAHPSEPPAKLLLSLLHPFSCSLSLSFLFPSRFPLPTSSAPRVQLSPSFQPLFNFHRFFLTSSSTTALFSFKLLSIFPSLPFRSSSSPSDPAPLQPCIIRPKHKPAQAHIWKEFGHGSFLPRRLNI